jgi:hypothetical protein
MKRTLLEGLCVVAVLGLGMAGGYAADANWQRGDMNCDGVVDFGDINPFVLGLTSRAGYEAQFPECQWLNADCNNDGQVDFGDINAFVALLVGPQLGQCWHSGCLPRSDGERGVCPPDEIEFSVQGTTLWAFHSSAEYNCCADDIVVSLTVQGNLIQLVEEEIATSPCWCTCCYDVEATVVGLTSGTYTVEYCWFEYDTLQVECYTEVVVIP